MAEPLSPEISTLFSGPQGEPPPGAGPKTLFSEQKPTLEVPAWGREKLLYRQSLDVKPDMAARVLKQRLATGLPVGVIERNIDEIEKRSEEVGFDPEKFRSANPKVAMWLLQDKNNAALGGNDVGPLKGLEDTFNAYTRGFTSARVNEDIGALMRIERSGGTLTSDQQADLKLHREKRRLIQEDSKNQGAAGWVAESTGNMLWQQGRSLFEMAKGAVYGGAVGTVAGTVLPGVGNVAGGAAGITAGALTASAMYTYDMEANSAFEELSSVKDISGQNIDRQTVIQFANAVGAINAGIEVMSDVALGKLLNLIPGGKQLSEMAGRGRAKQFVINGVKKSLEQPTTRAAMLKILGKMSGAAAIEGIEEFVQTLVGAWVGREGAQAASGQTFAPDSGIQDLEDAGLAAATAAVGTFLLGGIGGSVVAPRQIRQVRQAQQEQQLFQALGESVQASEVHKKLPEGMRDFVTTLKQGGAVENVYINVNQWDALFQNEGQRAATEVFGTPDQYIEARALGADLVIPIEVYAEKLAGTQFHDALLGDVRLNQDSLSANEAAKVQSQLDTLMEEQRVKAEEKFKTDEPSRQVYQTIYDQLTPFMGESEAARNATIEAAKYVAAAEQLGTDAWSLYSENPMPIRRDSTGAIEAQMTGEDVVAQDGEYWNASTQRLEVAGAINKTADGRYEFIDNTTGDVFVFDTQEEALAARQVNAQQKYETLFQVENPSFSIKSNKDGSIVVTGNPEEIRALLPKGIVGRVSGNTLTFSHTVAHRIQSGLEGTNMTYSREGKVIQKLPVKDGKYIGAPEKYNTPGKIPTLRKWLRKLADEGAPGRFWYENSSKAVLQFVGGDVVEARKFVALLAIYSPQAKVDTNSTFAIRAWAQYKAGQKIDVKTRVMDEKAQAALDNVDEFWSGEKTGNFFFNLLSEIDPATKGKHGATIDMWMMRAGRYANDAPSVTQYAFMENETNRLAAELGWEPQQVQAAIWVAMKARMENKGVKKDTEAKSEKRGWIRFEQKIDEETGKKKKVRVILDDQNHRDNWLEHAFAHDPTTDDTQQAKFDFSDGLRRHMGQVSWEPRPSTKLPILPGVHSAPYEQQVEFQQAVLKALRDQYGNDLIAMRLGLLTEDQVSGPGVWEKVVSAGSQARIVMAPSKGEDGKSKIDPQQKKLLEAYAAFLGILLHQDGVGYHRPFYTTTKTAQNAVELRIGKPFSQDQASELWSAMNKRMLALGLTKWENDTGLVSSQQGMRIVNYGVMEDNKAFRRLAEAAASEVTGDVADFLEFASDGNLVSNNWLEEKNGESYQQRVSASGRSDLLGWGRDVLAPRVQAVFNDFSQRYGWGDPGDATQGFPPRAPGDPVYQEVDPPLFQPKIRGMFERGSNTVTLLRSADPSTFQHEAAHAYLENLRRWAARPEASQQLKDDWTTVRNWFAKTADHSEALEDLRVRAESAEAQAASNPNYASAAITLRAAYDNAKKNGGASFLKQYVQGMDMSVPFASVYDVFYHERWARGWEAYLMEGKSPSIELQGAFARMKDWLVRIYKSILALNVELNPEIRAVMDRTVATTEQIKRAQEMSGVTEDVMSPDWMTSAERAAYEKLRMQAREEAETDIRTRLMSELVRERTVWYKAEKKQVTEEVTAEVDAQPVYIALSALQTGRLPDGREIPGMPEPIKLSRDAIVAQYGQDFLKTLPKPYVFQMEGGLHPDIAAEMFGFRTGGEMLTALVHAPNKKETITAEVDARMMERHGDMMNDGSLAESAAAAVANEKQMAVYYREMQILLRQGATGTLTSLDSIKGLAKRVIEGKRIKDISPSYYENAAAKAGRDAVGALVGKDPTFVRKLNAAFEARQRQILNLALFKEAVAAKKMFDSSMKSWKTLQKPDAKLAKGRNMDLVNTARAVLANFGVGASDRTPESYMEQLAKYDPVTHADLMPIVGLVASQKKPIRELTVDEFSMVRDAVDGLLKMSRSANQMLIDGRRVSKEEAKSELMMSLDERGKPYGKKGYSKAITSSEKRGIWMLNVMASLRRVEAWVDAMDGGNFNGPFRRYIWQPVSTAIANYRVDKRDVLKAYQEIMQKIEKSLTPDKIDAPEFDYTFGAATRSTGEMLVGITATGGGRAELLGAMLHTGNESNLGKLLVGRGWAEVAEDGTIDTRKWDTFVARMQKEGILGKAEYDYLQSTWDLLEQIKPAAQKAHHEIYGYYFKEVTANEFQTPYGSYRGGYFPAIVDSWIVDDADLREDKAALEAQGNSFMFPTTGRGWALTRVEGYRQPLMLDMRMVPQHIDKVLRFIHIEPRVKEVGRLMVDKEFRAAMNSFDPGVLNSMLMPWLQRSASQQITIPSETKAGRAFDKLANEIRSRTALQIMALNVANALQQLTGWLPASTKVRPGHLASALWAYTRSPRDTAEMISEKSTWMKTQIGESMFEIQSKIEEITVNPTKYDMLRDGAKHHAYILQSMLQSLVNHVTWVGAYNQALEGGANEATAVQMSDSAVRETQGSFNPEDLSSFEVGSPKARLLTMFYTYFNMLGNLYGTEISIAKQKKGMSKATRMFYLYATFALASALAEIITQAMTGDLWEEDDELLKKWMQIIFGSQLRTVAAMVPFVGPALMVGVNKFNDKFYDDRISTSPVFSTAETIASLPFDAIDYAQGEDKGKRVVKEVFTLIGLVTGLPMGALARPVGYAVDVEEGNVEPANAADYLRGLVSGKGPR